MRQSVTIFVYCLLGALGLFALWIILRTIVTRELLWAVKMLGLLIVLVGAVFGGAYLWIRWQERIPDFITTARIQADYGEQLARLRELAFNAGASAPELPRKAQVVPLFSKVGALEAGLRTANRGFRRVHGSLDSPRGWWALPPLEPGESMIVRGWGHRNGARVDTVEYLEAVQDATGASVVLQLTLELDALTSSENE